MHVAVQSVDVGAIQTVVMVAADKDFVAVWQITKPVKEINGFPLGPDHTEVTGMYHHIGLGQIPEPPVVVVSVGKV